MTTDTKATAPSGLSPKTVGILAIAIIIALLPFYAYSNLQGTYSQDREDTRTEDVELLLGIMNKLAEISEDKALQTGLAQFEVMRNAFTVLAETRNLIEHRNLLCQDATVREAFNVTVTVRQWHLQVCSRYENLLSVSLSNSIHAYQTAFNELILSLIELDNAISDDP